MYVFHRIAVFLCPFCHLNTSPKSTSRSVNNATVRKCPVSCCYYWIPRKPSNQSSFYVGGSSLEWLTSLLYVGTIQQNGRNDRQPADVKRYFFTIVKANNWKIPINYTCPLVITKCLVELIGYILCSICAPLTLIDVLSCSFVASSWQDRIFCLAVIKITSIW